MGKIGREMPEMAGDKMTRVVEINGIKMEIDLRTATLIESYKVGDSVKILIKGYGDSFKSHPGVIVGFDDFKSLPTIVVMYIEADGYSEVGIKMAYVNQKTEDVEIVAAQEHDKHYNKAKSLEYLDRQITKVEGELASAKSKKAYFLDMIGTHFGSWQPTE